jgi:hypothetical protein
MSSTISEAHVQMFGRNIVTRAQQMSSRLRPYMRVRTGIVGEAWTVERAGPADAVEITSRHSSTPLVDTPHDRRRGYLRDYAWADLIDKQDKVRLLADPQNAYSKAGAAAMGRQMDLTMITAASADVVTGKDGDGSASLGSGQQIAVDFVESGVATNSGLTIGKLREARRIFGVADVDDSDLEMDEYLCAIVSQQQITDLLREDEITNADYNTVRALVNGEIDTFMGFKFIRTQLLTLASATGYRTCLFTAGKGAIELGIGADLMYDVSIRNDLNLATQVYFSMSIGAVRVEEERVAECLCAEPT